LFSDLELHGSARLLLCHRRSIPNSPGSEYVIDPQPHQVALSLLSIAKLNMARSRRRLSIWRRTRMGQTSFGFSGRFWPIRRPLFHGVCCREAIVLSVVMLISEADPLRLSAGSRSIGFSPYLKWAQSRRNGSLAEKRQICRVLASQRTRSLWAPTDASEAIRTFDLPACASGRLDLATNYLYHL
jgi:hypothetical protein